VIFASWEQVETSKFPCDRAV